MFSCTNCGDDLASQNQFPSGLCAVCQKTLVGKALSPPEKRKVEGVYGVRFFNLNASQPITRLSACVVDHTYDSPTNYDKDPPPAHALGGHYAFNDKGFFNGGPHPTYPVVGIVEALGETRLGTKGWRSQGIVIRRILLVEAQISGVIDKSLLQMQNRYGCDVTVLKEHVPIGILGPVDLFKQRVLDDVLSLPFDDLCRWVLWINRKGELNRVKDLEDQHLLNIHHWLMSRGFTHQTPIVLEASRRNLI